MFLNKARSVELDITRKRSLYGSKVIYTAVERVRTTLFGITISTTEKALKTWNDKLPPDWNVGL